LLIKWGKVEVLLAFLIVLAGVLAGGNLATANELQKNIMTVDMIKPGMEGIGKTVIEGTKIVPFQVKVMGVVKGHGGKGDLILVRVGGKPIEEAGGIAQGMSGSPVYVNGKLIGAIGYGWELADHKLGLVTPIADMLKILQIQERQKTILDKPIQIGEKQVQNILVSNQPASIEQVKLALEQGTILMTPVKTPLLVSGIQGRAFQQLQDKLKSFNLEVMAGGGSASIPQQEISLQPGSALGVQLVRGHVEVGAIGTITYVQDKNILAFGHPFLNKGLVNLPLTTAYIHKTVPSIVAPFKLGSPMKMVGRITQDRSVGIAGEIGKYPPLTLVRIEIKDKDLGKTERSYFEVIKDSTLATTLTTSALLSTIDSSIDRIGKGNAKVSFYIQGLGLPKEGVKRENMFYSPNDVAAVSLVEIIEGLDMILNNEYKAVDLTEIKVEIEVGSQEKTARIEKAEAKTKQVRPGDTAEIAVTYKPFRGQSVTTTVKVKIPKDTPKGSLNLNVRGGSIPLYLAPNANQEEQENGQGNQQAFGMIPSPFNSLEEMLTEFVKRDKNNEIIIDEAPKLDIKQNSDRGESMNNKNKAKLKELAGETEPRKELPKANLVLGEGDKEEPKIKAALATDYVLEGFTMVNLEVVEKK